MDVTTAISGISYALRGTDDDAPLVGSDEWTYWLSVLNRKKDELYRDLTKQWPESFLLDTPVEKGTVATTGTTTLTGTGTKFTDYRAGDKVTVDGETVRTIDTITSDTVLAVTVAFTNTASSKTFTRETIIATGVESYSLNRSFIAPSDTVYVLDTAGKKHYFEFTKPQARTSLNTEVFISGVNPKVLNFSTAPDAIVGGTLHIPGYYLPADLTAGTDLLPFSDPQWGVLAAAADIASRDITYEDRTEGLMAAANNLFDQMAIVARRATYGSPRRIPSINKYHIRGY